MKLLSAYYSRHGKLHKERPAQSAHIPGYAAVIAAMLWVPMLAFGQNSATRQIPRTPEGKPDLAGFWQVISSADWNIQDHSAEKGIPAGQGIVVGNEIPYLPAAAEKRKANYAHRDTDDPGLKSYVP